MYKNACTQVVAGGLVAFLCASCSWRATRAPVSASAPLSNGPVISRIVQRRDVILVRAGVNGPTYSLVSKDGTILVNQMTLTQLSVSNPEMFHAIKTMEASEQWAGGLDR